MSTPADYFRELFEHSDDPWAFDRRWYEQRKRDLTLACLPRQRYARAFEPGCANGVLSHALAQRCDSLLAMDLTPRAVELATQRLAPFEQVEVCQGGLPQAWPTGHFDLIVLSEMGYYLDPHAWAQVVEHAAASLAEGGHVLACHWLHPIEGAPQQGEQVHWALEQGLGLEKLASHREQDFLLEVWGAVQGID